MLSCHGKAAAYCFLKFGFDPDASPDLFLSGVDSALLCANKER